LTALADKSPRVRGCAIVWLGRQVEIRESCDWKELQALTSRIASPGTRDAALLYDQIRGEFGPIGSPSHWALVGLAIAARDSEPTLRWSTLKEVVRVVRNRRASIPVEAVFRPLLRDQDVAVRLAAVDALYDYSRMRCDTDLISLLPLLDDPESAVRIRVV